MEKMSNGTIEINYEKSNKQLIVVLNTNQYQSVQLKLSEALFIKQGALLEGTIQEVTEEKAVIDYIIPETAVPLSQVNTIYDEVDRLAFAQSLRILTTWEHSAVIPFLHPENLFSLAGQLVIAHRGIRQIAEPKENTLDSFLQQYKALTITIIHPKYDYDQLVSGVLAVKDPFSQQIIKASSIEEIQGIVSQQYHAMLEKRKLSEKLVNKNRYRFFKWCLPLLSIAVIGFAWSTYVFGQQKLPQKDRIIASEAAFIGKDYDQATDELKNDQPDKLPSSAQYVLAASYVNLDDLTNEQKESVLNTLSQKSTTNELLFWIYLGRGEFDQSLSVAQNIGDDQLILHAYTKLYEATKANSTMSGAKKQKQLEEYQKQVDDYTKKLGGEEN